MAKEKARFEEKEKTQLEAEEKARLEDEKNARLVAEEIPTHEKLLRPEVIDHKQSLYKRK